MDSGKVLIRIPADVMALERVGEVAAALGVALRRQGLGDVVSFAELAYEPFTPETREYGRRWNQITLDLARPVDLRQAATMFLAAGAPPSAHVTYTDRMRMCGDTLGRV